jgi:adenylate cyclase
LEELNLHFAPLVGALKKHGAYVDNYVGDLVMALFGAPVSAGDFSADVRAATLAALEFVQLVEARNQKRHENGQFPIEVGIGVHCGVAVVGNLGTRDPQGGGKIHYTAIGDVVNVASRVESATRGQNVTLLVTREVVEVGGEMPGLPPWCRIGEISVKGRSAPVEIFKMG